MYSQFQQSGLIVESQSETRFPSRAGVEVPEICSLLERGIVKESIRRASFAYWNWKWKKTSRADSTEKQLEKPHVGKTFVGKTLDSTIKRDDTK